MSSTQHQNPFARTSLKTDTQFSLIPGVASAGNNPFSPSKSLIPGEVSAGNNPFSPSKSLVSGSVSAGNKSITTSNPFIPGGVTAGNNPFSTSKSLISGSVSAGNKSIATSNPLIPGGTSIRNNPSKPLGESFISNTEPEVPRTISAEIGTSTEKKSLKTKKEVPLVDNIVHQEINSQAKSQEILNIFMDLNDNLQIHNNNITKLITENHNAITSRLEKLEQTVSLLNYNLTNKLSEQMNNYEIIMEKNVNQISLQTQETINSRIQNFNTKWQEKTAKFITEEDLKAMLDTILNTFKTEVATMIDNRIAHLTENYSTDDKSLPQQQSTTSLQSSDEN